MIKTFYYTDIKEMKPRPGVSYFTKYVLQDREERKKMADRFVRLVTEFRNQARQDPQLDQALSQPVPKMKAKTDKSKRTFYEVMDDIIQESLGKRTNGTPKDFAMAPIERWNHAFPDYAVELEQGIRPTTTFGDLFKQNV